MINVRKRMQDNKAITLVALVVTIVVLIILAGISLSLVLGQNGIVNKAKEARDKTQADQLNTEIAMNTLYDDMEGKISAGGPMDLSKVNTVKEAKENNAIPIADNKTLTDDNTKTVIVPAGFKISSDSATTVNEGIVIEDKDGNQYVWIPVENISDYKRTTFSTNVATGTIDTSTNSEKINYSSSNTNYFIEAMPSDELASVTTYKGYYIGRYEAGDSVSTANKTLRSDGASISNKVAIKKDQAPYNWITRDQAKTLAEGIKTAEEYTKGTTKLCSSYAWDTVISFIQRTNTDYGASSGEGNYNDTTFSYTDITGATQTKEQNASVLIPTGQATAVSNIYDMGGNESEWTTESFSSSNIDCVFRGGTYKSNFASIPSGFRDTGYTTSSLMDYIGFRVTLYL